MLFVSVLAVQLNAFYHSGAASASTSTSVTSYQATSVSGTLITPSLSLPAYPAITAEQPFGSRLTGMNVPLNATELAVINNASSAYFVTAAQMYLNKSLTILVGAPSSAAPLLLVNGKPSVMYLGAISCVYCAENRWAMALALGQFGGFTQLFNGYSSFNDEDVPTIYWAPAQYNATQGVDFGNFYTSKYVNFISMDYASPITQGFQVGTLTYFQQEATATANAAYEQATNTFIKLNNFAGTPYTIWGKFSVTQADAADFGDASSTATTSLPMASLTQGQILNLLAPPHTPFGWDEYAAADFYIALLCASMSLSRPGLLSALDLYDGLSGLACTLPTLPLVCLMRPLEGSSLGVEARAGVPIEVGCQSFPA